MAISLTESAAKHVAAQLKRRGKGMGLRGDLELDPGVRYLGL